MISKDFSRSQDFLQILSRLQIIFKRKETVAKWRKKIECKLVCLGMEQGLFIGDA